MTEPFGFQFIAPWLQAAGSVTAQDANHDNALPPPRAKLAPTLNTLCVKDDCPCKAHGALCDDCAPKRVANPLSAKDVRDARHDREPWSGKIFDETRLALAVQVLTSIRDEQSGANSAVKALAEATLEVIG